MMNKFLTHCLVFIMFFSLSSPMLAVQSNNNVSKKELKKELKSNLKKIKKDFKVQKKMNPDKVQNVSNEDTLYGILFLVGGLLLMGIGFSGILGFIFGLGGILLFLVGLYLLLRNYV